MNNKKNNLVFLGSCKKVHGIRGELSLHLENPEDSVLKKNLPVTLKRKEKILGSFHISSIRFGNKVILKLKEIQDRNSAEELVPFDLYVDRKFFPELEVGEFYLSDLIGFKAIDEEARKEGEVKGFLTTNFQTLVQVLWQGETQAQEIPWVDEWVLAIDSENQIMHIRYMDLT